MPLLRIMLGLSLYFLFLNTEILSFSFCQQFTSKDSFKSATVRPKEMLVVLFWYFIAQSQSNGVQRNWWIASREMLKNLSKFMVYVSPEGVLIAKCELKMEQKQFL